MFLKNIIIISLFTCFTIVCNSQTTEVESSILSEEKTNELFTGKIKNELGINFPIFKAYHYKDGSGEYYQLLTERKYGGSNEEPLNDSIKAFNISSENGKLKVNYVTRDFIKENDEEPSIWFWTKYCEFKDLDGDNLVDPVLVYGTSGINGLDDGRVKILIFYKGQKYAIRHQSGTLDFERKTLVDQSFYNLPGKIQEFVMDIMKQIEEKTSVIFPSGYEQKMKEKAVKIDENK